MSPKDTQRETRRATLGAAVLALLVCHAAAVASAEGSLSAWLGPCPSGGPAAALGAPGADWAYQCEGLVCACAAGGATRGGPIVSEDVWNIIILTVAQGAAAETELLILVTPTLTGAGGTASACEVQASAAFYDLEGALLATQEATLSAAMPAWVVPQPPVNAGALRKRFRVGARGSARGCTLDELRGLGAVVTTRDLETGGVVAERRVAPTLTFPRPGAGVPPLVPDHVFPPAARGASPVLAAPCPEDYAYQCRGLACRCVAEAAVYADTGIDPPDLIWGIERGTASQAAAGETVEVVLSAAPLSPDSACRLEGMVDIATLGGETLAAQPANLSPAAPSLVVEWEHPGSGALAELVVVRARGVATGCLMGELAPLEMSVSTYGTATGKTVGTRPFRPLLIVAEEVEGEATASQPLPIRPAYGFPPARRLRGSD